MATDLKKVKLGPCKVTINPGEAGAIVLETFKGGNKYKFKQNTVPVTLDATGSTSVKEITDGIEASLELMIAEHDLALIHAMTPDSKLYTDTTSGNKAVHVSGNAGYDLLEDAVIVQIDPLQNATIADRITFPKATLHPETDQSYEVGSVRVFKVVVKAHPDPSTPNNTPVIYGDAAIPTTAP